MQPQMTKINQTVHDRKKHQIIAAHTYIHKNVIKTKLKQNKIKQYKTK